MKCPTQLQGTVISQGWKLRHNLSSIIFILGKRKDVDVQDQNKAPGEVVCHMQLATCEAAVDMSGDVLQDQVQLPRGWTGHTDFTINLNRTRPRYPLGEAAPGYYSFTELATQMLVLATCSQQSVRQQPTGVLCWKVHQTTLCSQKDSDLK